MMLIRILSALAGLFVMSCAHAAGTIPLSLTQQLDSSGAPLSGGKMYFYQAGTVATPQNAYQDSALTIPWPNPITLNSRGQVPQLFFADGSIKVVLTNATGVTQFSQDGILVIGASSGGGGGSPIDSTTIFATGDIKTVYGTATLSGWVRMNGRTIGSATSGASERANSDTQALFLYLCAIDSSKVSGHSGTCQNDWDANRVLTLPDARGRTFAMLDDMGTSSAGRYGSATFTSGNATTLGSVLGNAQKTLAQSNLPNVSPTFSGSSATITMAKQYLGGSGITAISLSAGTQAYVINFSGAFIDNPSASYTPAGTISSINGGVGQTAFDLYTPSILVTAFIKL